MSWTSIRFRTFLKGILCSETFPTLTEKTNFDQEIQNDKGPCDLQIFTVSKHTEKQYMLAFLK